jgi:aerobic carbon-monoxide dehydrogenase small subunit
MKQKIQLTVNGQDVGALVEPRLQLAEFLREQLLLTGTHLGCEHGVCGACTIEIDGAPARSCITYAVACNGSEVRTIEGFDGDEVMAELREAFSVHHALQCGFCTPGMLMTARDIVLRLPEADEARIRKELAGNLCRCTGYVGIVRAIQSVLLARHDARGLPPPAGIQHEVRTDTVDRGWSIPLAPQAADIAQAHSSGTPPPTGTSAGAESGRRDSNRAGRSLRQSFVVDHPRAKVWEYFARLDEVTSCLPGAVVTGTPAPDRVETTLRVKLGPIATDFKGVARVERDQAAYSGLIHGNARDERSSSSTRGEIRYVLNEEKSGAGTRVDLEIDYTLSGTLAQFGRSGIVQDIAKRMTAAFAANLESRLNETREGAPTHGREPHKTELNAASLLLSALWTRVKGYVRSLFRLP